MLKRVAAIDYGLTRIGLAMSDPNQIIASPLKMVLNQKALKETALAVLKELKDHQIEKIVVGMPYRLNGKLSFSSDETLSFIEELKKHTDLPIETWDERLTTVQVERAMKDNNLSRKKRSKVIDAACATLILQSYLDQKSNTLLPPIPSYG